MNDLLTLQFPPKTIKFIENLISCRHVQFVIHGSLMSPTISRKGTPQGSVLSPTLFNIYLRKLEDQIHPLTKIIQFADDIVIYSTSPDIRCALQSIENSLNRIAEYLQGRGFDISTFKTQMMVFSKRRVPPSPEWHILSDTHMLSPVPTYRFLGIILDSGLTGRPHLESTTIKAKKILQVLSAIRNTWWSAHPQLLLTVYRSMLRASIEYGSLVFGLSRSRTFRKLEVLQNHAVRTCLGCQISTPVNTLFAEAKKLPLHLRFQFLAEKFFIKILSVTITSQQKLYSDWQMPPPPLTITVSFPICQLTSLPLFFSGKWLIVALINPTLFLLTGTLFLPFITHLPLFRPLPPPYWL